MSLVSIYTVGRLKHPIDHPASLEFYEVGNDIFGKAIMFWAFSRGIFT